MQSQRIYCGACDTEVRVMITDTPSEEGQAPLHDSEVVCLEIGDRCNGNLCPLGATAPTEMVTRLLRNGLPTDGLRTVQAHCPSCDLDNDIVLYGEGRAVCSACGAAARWVAEHVEPM
jgi:hypothetical protein